MKPSRWMDVNTHTHTHKSPTIITGPSQRPSVVNVDVNKLYVIELTGGFETQITINTERRKRNYEQLCRQLSNYFDKVKDTIKPLQLFIFTNVTRCSRLPFE